MSSSHLGSQSGEPSRQRVPTPGQSSRDQVLNKSRGQIEGPSQIRRNPTKDSIRTQVPGEHLRGRDLSKADAQPKPLTQPLRDQSATLRQAEAPHQTSNNPGADGTPMRPQGDKDRPLKTAPRSLIAGTRGRINTAPQAPPRMAANNPPNRPHGGQIRPGSTAPFRSSASPNSVPFGGSESTKPSSVSGPSRSRSSNQSGILADSTKSVEAFIKRNAAEPSGGPSDIPQDFVLCVDGTTNEKIDEPRVKDTNIARISDLIKLGEQGGRMVTVNYQRGIGSKGASQTDRVPKTKDVLTDWYQVLNAPFEAAWPTEDLVARMVSINFAYISMRVHPKKDKIFIFGFSRGAYISQITASLVADVGVLTYQKYLDYCGNNPGKSYTRIVYEIVRGWIECQGNHVKLKAKLARYKDCLVPMNIEFLGLFDTVASVGLSDLGTANLQSKRFCFAEEINSRPSIINAYHAVAISEHRNQFKPVLWKSGSPDPRRNIAQVWFPGYHTSIGGGSDEQGIMLSFIALVWMLSKCTGLAHAVKEQELTNMIIADAKHAVSMRNKEIPDSKKGAWARPVMGDHVRKELGLSTIDKLHRICDEDQWRVRCAPKMPSIRGLGGVRIQRTQEMLDKRQFDTGNKFETRFFDKMVKIMSTQLSDSGPSPNRQGRRQASTVDQARIK